MKKILSSMMVAGLLLAGTACGGDDDAKDTTATEAPADSGDSGDAGDSGNADVEKFCADAEELGQQLKDVMADPTSGDVAGITAKAQELAASAAQLSSANADDVDRINECAAKITEALGG